MVEDENKALWGYIDKTGAFVIEPHSIAPMNSARLAPVSVEGKLARTIADHLVDNSPSAFGAASTKLFRSKPKALQLQLYFTN